MWTSRGGGRANARYCPDKIKTETADKDETGTSEEINEENIAFAHFSKIFQKVLSTQYYLLQLHNLENSSYLNLLKRSTYDTVCVFACNWVLTFGTFSKKKKIKKKSSQYYLFETR
jgi:hypothetical protein